MPRVVPASPSLRRYSSMTPRGITFISCAYRAETASADAITQRRVLGTFCAWRLCSPRLYLVLGRSPALPRHGAPCPSSVLRRWEACGLEDRYTFPPF